MSRRLLSPIYASLPASAGLEETPRCGAGTAFGDGLRVRDSIPQSHKVALRAIAEGEAVLRYGQVIGAARHP